MWGVYTLLWYTVASVLLILASALVLTWKLRFSFFCGHSAFTHFLLCKKKKSSFSSFKRPMCLWQKNNTNWICAETFSLNSTGRLLESFLIQGHCAGKFTSRFFLSVSKNDKLFDLSFLHHVFGDSSKSFHGYFHIDLAESWAATGSVVLIIQRRLVSLTPPPNALFNLR